MRKLHLVLDVYRGLADITIIRGEVVKKVVSMLLHPFPKIRVAAAQTLFVITNGDAELKRHDWTQSLKVLKSTVDDLKSRADQL
jgi:hypothetical protein